MPDKNLPLTSSSGWPFAIWAGLIGVPLLVAGGQVLFKIVSDRMVAADAASFRALLFDPYFITAVGVYAATSVCWILVLRVTPLGVAYSFTSLGFLFVPLISWYLFGEALTLRYFLGAFLIMTGLLVIHS